MIPGGCGQHPGLCKKLQAETTVGPDLSANPRKAKAKRGLLCLGAASARERLRGFSPSALVALTAYAILDPSDQPCFEELSCPVTPSG